MAVFAAGGLPFTLIRSVTGAAFLVLLALACPAWASFPGANGLLAVQPVNGSGVIVVAADGSGAKRICADGVCRRARGPVWSADGRELVYVAGSGSLDVIYPDGSCLDCGVTDSARNSGFTPSGDILAFPSAGGSHAPFEVDTVGIDGLGERRVLQGPVSSAAWSAQNRLAFVRTFHGQDEVFVADARGRHARQLTHTGASAPSWSPDGHFLAVVHAGSVALIDMRGRLVRVLGAGESPAFSPDGQQVAYIGTHDHVMVISARGGRSRAVGAVRGTHVDWQPIPSRPPGVCAAPAGSITIVSSPDLVVTGRTKSSSNAGGSETTTAYLACLPPLNRERLLAVDSSSDSPNEVFSYTTRGGWLASGDYVKSSYSVNESYHGEGGSSGGTTVTNMLSGCSFDVALPYPDPNQPEAGSQVSAFVLSPGGYVAWETDSGPTSNGPGSEDVYAEDAAGTHQLDSETIPGSPTGLANLSIAGNQVTWTHDGQQMSATLGKPVC